MAYKGCEVEEYLAEQFEYHLTGQKWSSFWLVNINYFLIQTFDQIVCKVWTPACGGQGGLVSTVCCDTVSATTLPNQTGHGRAASPACPVPRCSYTD